MSCEQLFDADSPILLYDVNRNRSVLMISSSAASTSADVVSLGRVYSEKMTSCRSVSVEDLRSAPRTVSAAPLDPDSEAVQQNTEIPSEAESFGFKATSESRSFETGSFGEKCREYWSSKYSFYELNTSKSVGLWSSILNDSRRLSSDVLLEDVLFSWEDGRGTESTGDESALNRRLPLCCHSGLSDSLIEDSWPKKFLLIRAKAVASREKVIGLPIITSTPKRQSPYVFLNDVSPSGKVGGLTDLEELVYAATSDEECVAPAELWKEISDWTFEPFGVHQVTGALWHRMLDKNEGKFPRVLKSLDLLLFLLQHGSEEIIVEAKTHMVELSSLANDYCLEKDDEEEEDDAEDDAKYVRRRAITALYFLTHDDLLMEERTKVKILPSEVIVNATEKVGTECPDTLPETTTTSDLSTVIPNSAKPSVSCQSSYDPIASIDAFEWFRSLGPSVTSGRGNKVTVDCFDANKVETPGNSGEKDGANLTSEEAAMAGSEFTD